MRRNLTILFSLIIAVMFALPVSAERTLPLLIDDANLLTANEYDTLLEILEDVSTRGQCEVAVVTVNSLGSKSAMAYADDFFDDNGYGYGDNDDGVLLLISMGEREWHITTHGYGTIALTVAHTSVYADHYGQDHRDETVEYMDTGRQVFRYVLCPYGNGWQTAALNRRAALLNRPLPRVVETYHEGPLPGEYSGLSISDPSVDVSVIKRSEDDLGWVIRLSETTGQPRTAHISAAFASREMDAALSSFQLKTLYLPDDPAQPFSECLLTEL